MKKNHLPLLLTLALTAAQCTGPQQPAQETAMPKIPVLLDTDTNCEIDDQHAMAYLLLSGDRFDVRGVTVNATERGGPIDRHFAEAERIAKLCGVYGKIPVVKGADGSFDTIRTQLDRETFDGQAAVRFIIEQARAAGSTTAGGGSPLGVRGAGEPSTSEQKLLLLAIGKLTNLALAFELAPDIAGHVRIVWLGTNYPRPGETNLVADTAAMNYILQLDVPLDIVTVDFRGTTGTYAVRVTQDEINERMPGLGPRVDPPVPGRAGGSFHTFGDYSVDLFDHINFRNEDRSRAIFDVVAVAILKNPDWGDRIEMPCPRYTDEGWIDQPENPRKIGLWKNFDEAGIKADFYRSLQE